MTPTHVTTRSIPIVLALIAALVAVFGMVFNGATAAHADIPDPPVVEPFTAPLCEGTTPSDPADAAGPVPDLTLVFGQRLVDYNSGQLVHLYGSAGENSQVPSCTVRHVDGVGPVSEWTYCTDIELHTCNYTTEDGSLVAFPPSEDPEFPVPDSVPGPTPFPGNARLTEEQERLIAYIIRTDIPVIDGVDGSGTASNADDASRTNRQYLVWCISDPGVDFLVDYCAANLDAAQQQRLLALVPAEAELTFALSPDSTDLDIGETAHVSVTTNVYNQPIVLSITGGEATVCEGDASLTGGALTVNGTDAATDTTIVLCVTTTTAGTVTISGSATPTSREHLSWVQSTPDCQVYATFESSRAAPVTSSATVQFRDLVGGFSVVKLVDGDAASLVAGDTSFTVEYTVDEGQPQTLTLSADGAVTAIDGLAAGAVVTLTEVDLPAVAGVIWREPVFTVDGEAASTVTIAGNQTIAVELTNTAGLAPVEETPEPEPSASPVAPEPSASPVAPEPPASELPSTGGAIGWSAAGAGAILVAVGIALLVLRRREVPRRRSV